jgi:hypothetical protein
MGEEGFAKQGVRVELAFSHPLGDLSSTFSTNLLGGQDADAVIYGFIVQPQGHFALEEFSTALISQHLIIDRHPKAEAICLYLKNRIAANCIYASMKLLWDTVDTFFKEMTPEKALAYAGVEK